MESSDFIIELIFMFRIKVVFELDGAAVKYRMYYQHKQMKRMNLMLLFSPEFFHFP